MIDQESTARDRSVILSLALQLDGPTALYWIQIYGQKRYNTLETVAQNIPEEIIPGVIKQLKLTLMMAKMKKFITPN